MKVKRDTLLEKAINQYFQSQYCSFKCTQCLDQIEQNAIRRNFIDSLPPILTLDMQFQDDQKNFIKKTFDVPEFIDLKDYILPSMDSDSDEVVTNSCYQLFGIIALDCHDLKHFNYVSLVKKQLKSENKTQWFGFHDGFY